MKIEMEISGKNVAKLLVVAVIGIVIGYGLAIATLPAASITESSGEGQAGTSRGEIDYLKSSDLNRQDIQASILLSRFCEGLGLQSSVYWQQDAEGNVFGTPICLPPQQ